MVAAQTIPFFVGTYTQAAGHVLEPAGLGIQSCYLDTTTGLISFGPVYSEIENPAWLQWRGNNLFVAYESFSGPSALYQFSVDLEQTLTLQTKADCSGTSMCHLTLLGDTVFTAAYMSGQLDSYDASDQLRHISSIQYHGNGPNKTRQEAAHAHHIAISPDGNWYYICDLGSDRIWRHKTNDAMLIEPVGIEVPAGSGPRHLVFHPTNSTAYLLAELTAELLTFQYESKTGDLVLKEQLSTLPADFQGLASAAGIVLHPSGKALYFSNRQHDSVNCYTIQSDGSPTFEQRVTSGGQEPRAMTVDPTGQWLLVANQDSHSIVSYQLDSVTGKLTGANTSYVNLGSPVCISFQE